MTSSLTYVATTTPLCLGVQTQVPADSAKDYEKVFVLVLVLVHPLQVLEVHRRTNQLVLEAVQCRKETLELLGDLGGFHCTWHWKDVVGSTLITTH